MGDQVYEVILDGGGPWGFRLQGGKDFGIPLNVARITPGSKANMKKLMPGDQIVEINGTDVEPLSHMEAQNLIKNAGSRLQLKLKPGKASGAMAANPKVLTTTHVVHSAGVDHQYNAKPKVFNPGSPASINVSVSPARSVSPEPRGPVIQAPKFDPSAYAKKKKEELDKLKEKKKETVQDSDILKMINQTKISDEPRGGGAPPENEPQQPPATFRMAYTGRDIHEEVNPGSNVLDNLKARQQEEKAGLHSESKVPSRVFQMLQKQYDDDDAEASLLASQLNYIDLKNCSVPQTADESIESTIKEHGDDQRVFRMTYDSRDIRSAAIREAGEITMKDFISLIGAGSQDVMASLKQRLAEKQSGGKSATKTPSRVHAYLQNQFCGEEDGVGERYFGTGTIISENSSVPQNASIPSKVFQALQQSMVESGQAPPVHPDYNSGPAFGRQSSNDALDKARSLMWEEKVLGMKSESKVPSRSFRLLQHLYDQDDGDTQSSASGGSAHELQSALDVFEKELEYMAQPEIQKTVVELPNFSRKQQQQQQQQWAKPKEKQPPPVTPQRNNSYPIMSKIESRGYTDEETSSGRASAKDDGMEEAVVVAHAPVAQLMTYTAHVETPWMMGEGSNRVPNKRIPHNHQNGLPPKNRPLTNYPVTTVRQVNSQHVPLSGVQRSGQSQPALSVPGRGYRPQGHNSVGPSHQQDGSSRPNNSSSLSNGNYRQQEPEISTTARICAELNQQAYFVKEEPSRNTQGNSAPDVMTGQGYSSDENKQQQHVTYASVRRGSERLEGDQGFNEVRNSSQSSVNGNDNHRSAFSEVRPPKKSNMNIVTNSVGKPEQDNRISSKVSSSSSERSAAEDLDDVIKELDSYEQMLNNVRIPKKTGLTEEQKHRAIDASNVGTVPQTPRFEMQMHQSKPLPPDSSNSCPSDDRPGSLNLLTSPQRVRAISPSKDFSSIPASALYENRKPRPWQPQGGQPELAAGNVSQSAPAFQQKQSQGFNTQSTPATVEQFMRHVHPDAATKDSPKNTSSAVQVQGFNAKQLNISGSDKNPAKDINGRRESASPVTVHVQKRRSFPVESFTDSYDEPSSNEKGFVPIDSGISQVDHNANEVYEGPKQNSRIVISSVKRRQSSNSDVFDDNVDPSRTGRPRGSMEKTSSSSSSGSITSIKISSVKKEKEESMSSGSQPSMCSLDEDEELSSGIEDVVPYQISSRRKSSVKSTGQGVKISIPLANPKVSSGTARAHLPPPPPELIGETQDDYNRPSFGNPGYGQQSKTFRMLQDAVNEGKTHESVFSRPPEERNRAVPMPVQHQPKGIQSTTVNPIPKAPMPQGPNYKISSPKAPSFRPTGTASPPSSTWKPPGTTSPPASTWKPPGTTSPPASTWKPPGATSPPNAPSYTPAQPSTYSPSNAESNGQPYSPPQAHAAPQRVTTKTPPEPTSAVDSKRQPHCAGCNEVIRGPFVTAIGKTWHPEHFCCASCGNSLQNQGFVEEEGKLYCEKCFNDFFAPKCAACGNAIIGNCVNAIGKTFHPEHFVCHNCGKNFSGEGFLIEGGNPYCENCYDSIFSVKCGGCNRSIGGGERYVEALDRNWHTDCFCCAVCRQRLEGTSFYVIGGRPLCALHKSGS